MLFDEVVKETQLVCPETDHVIGMLQVVVKSFEELRVTP